MGTSGNVFENFTPGTKWWKEEQQPQNVRKTKRGEESERMLSVESNWTVVRKETHVVSVMVERLETDASREKKTKAKAQTDGKIPSKKVQVEKVLLEQEAGFQCRCRHFEA